MRLPREATTGTRIRRTAGTLLALSASLTLTAIVPSAMRNATAGHRIDTGGPVPVTVAAGGDSMLPPLPDSPTVAATIAPAEQQYDRGPFTINLPDGWSGGEIFDSAFDADRTFEYTDGRSRFFRVHMDPEGSGFSADEVWLVDVVDGEQFAVVGSRSCAAGEAMCDRGNGSFLGYGIWSEGGSAEAAGHTFYFTFEDHRTENPNIEVFRTILESISVAS